MSTPSFKVYTPEGEYIGCVRDAEDAAALVGLRGDGGTIRWQHRHIVWREGREDWLAGESYDQTAAVIYKRVQTFHTTSSSRLREAQDAFASRQGLSS